MLLLLLQLLYNKNFEYDSLEYLQNFHSLKSNNAVPFDTFSLKTIEPVKLSSLKIILNEPNLESNIPLPIFMDPFIYIDISFVWEESENYQFEFFKFYKNVNEKVKY